jgi:CHAD domain-containing protein
MAGGKDRDLNPGDPYRDAMQELIAARFSAVWTALPVAAAGVDPEGVHDVRVASRRLRAAMDVAADSFPEPWYRGLHRAVKDITSELGEVRDRDVMLEFLSAERDKAPAQERVGINRLIARVDAERAIAREEMLTFLNELDSAGVANESIRRFGASAAPKGDDAAGS